MVAWSCSNNNDRRATTRKKINNNSSKTKREKETTTGQQRRQQHNGTITSKIFLTRRTNNNSSKQRRNSKTNEYNNAEAPDNRSNKRQRRTTSTAHWVARHIHTRLLNSKQQPHLQHKPSSLPPSSANGEDIRASNKTHRFFRVVVPAFRCSCCVVVLLWMQRATHLRSFATRIVSHPSLSISFPSGPLISFFAPVFNG